MTTFKSNAKQFSCRSKLCLLWEEECLFWLVSYLEFTVLRENDNSGVARCEGTFVFAGAARNSASVAGAVTQKRLAPKL